MLNGTALLLVGSFTQLYRLLTAQLQQHLVGGVVAVLWPALAKAANCIGINRQGAFAGSFDQQTVAGCGLHSVVGVLLGDFEA